MAGKVRIAESSGWRQRLDDEVHDFMEDLAEAVYDDMRNHCPIDTGFLYDDLYFEVSGTSFRAGALTCEYAQAVEEGTRPHVIRAKNKKALSWPGARHPVAEVNHPGTTGTHFMREALFRSRKW